MTLPPPTNNKQKTTNKKQQSSAIKLEKRSSHIALLARCAAHKHPLGVSLWVLVTQHIHSFVLIALSATKRNEHASKSSRVCVCVCVCVYLFDCLLVCLFVCVFVCVFVWQNKGGNPTDTNTPCLSAACSCACTRSDATHRDLNFTFRIKRPYDHRCANGICASQAANRKANRNQQTTPGPRCCCHPSNNNNNSSDKPWCAIASNSLSSVSSCSSSPSPFITTKSAPT